ncbi:MAG: ABC transporter permease [Gemmataceae bacterium]|nr:ABC transporter permease [Gemmataceae bacterium]
MTLALVRKLLRDVRWAMLIIALLLFGFECLWVKVTHRAVTQLSPFFTTLAERAGVAAKVIEDQIFSGPGKIVQTLAGGENMRFERAADMLSIGYVHPLVVLILCLWAVGRAALALTGELDRGTLELLLAQPIPRGRVVLAHVLVDLVALPMIATALWLGTWVGCRLIGPFEVNLEEAQKVMAGLPFQVKVDPQLLVVDPSAFARLIVPITALMTAVSGVTLAISAGGRFRGRVLGTAVVLFLVMFLINTIGQLWDVLTPLRPYTVFYYYQPQKIALANNWMVMSPLGEVPGPAVLFTVGLIGYLVAWWRFRTRDIPAPL